MIGLLGIDHQRASADVRGRLSFTDAELLEALRRVYLDGKVDEVAILSTCNRTEVYVSTADWAPASAAVRRFLESVYTRYETHEAAAAITLPGKMSAMSAASAASTIDTMGAASSIAALPAAEALPFYEAHDQAAARHLFRVAAGLESLVVGESQIVGQVKDALAAAEAVQTAGDELRALFTAAGKVGRRVRAETEIGRADTSVAALAVQVAREALGDLAGKTALIVGAGKTSRLCAQLLREAGIGWLVVANRTRQTAAALAEDVGGAAIALREVGEALHANNVELVISATGAPHVVLDAATVARGLAGRHTPLVVIDLAVPPDVEEAVGLLPNVSLYSLDNLRAGAAPLPTAVPDVGPDAVPGGGRGEAIGQAERLIEEGLAAYARGRTVRLLVPGIAGLRQHVDRSEAAERARVLARLAHLSEADREEVARYGQRLVDKMFHHLVSRIRSLAEYDEVPPEVTLRVLSQLFADPETPENAAGADLTPGPSPAGEG